MDALKESIFELQQRNQQLQDELKAFTATIRPFPTYSSSKQRTKINPYEDFPEGPVGASEKVPEVNLFIISVIFIRLRYIYFI